MEVNADSKVGKPVKQLIRSVAIEKTFGLPGHGILRREQIRAMCISLRPDYFGVGMSLEALLQALGFSGF